MRILYGITGGIAAYKAPEVVRALRKRGHEVRCVVTASAQRLVASAALAAVSNQRVFTSLWPGDEGTDDGSMPHIELARWADAVLIAPLTADAAARFALGLADDLLGTLMLALEPERPLWIAPAMNSVMWNKPVVQGHLATLVAAGARLIPPIEGTLACGEEGIGAMASPETIAAALADAKA